MVVTKREPAEAERGGRVDPDRQNASVQDLDPGDAPQHLRVRDEQAGLERPARMDDDEERRRRAARIKRLNDAMDERIGQRIDRGLDQRIGQRIDRGLDQRIGQRLDEGMKRRAREAMERRRDWYAQVGIHRAFARDSARYMAGVSC